MRRCWWVTGLAGLSGLLLCLSVAVAQDKKPADEPKKPEPAKKAEEPKKAGDVKKDEKPGGAGGAEMEEMMKKWAAYATPGEAHKRLDGMVGKWDFECSWCMKPGDEPETMKGTTELKWIYDGRYVQQEASGPAMDPNGPPFKGTGLYGYDNAKKQYVTLWFDNMGTGVMFGYGTADASGKEITFTGEGVNPMNDKNEKWRCVLHLGDKDKFTYEMYGPGPDGKEFRQMLLTYTRAK